MKLLAWNCRGIAQDTAVLQLKAMVKNRRIDILFLSEIKIQMVKITSVLRSVGFQSIEIIPAIGIAGGVCLAWKQFIDIDIVVSNKNLISANIKGEVGCPLWNLTGVYAPSKKRYQAVLWDTLSKMNESMIDPWMIIGDFNSFLNEEDKLGGLRLADSNVGDFQRFVDDAGLIDIGFSGSPYTWNNRSFDGKFIQIRLDRGLANPDWRGTFPKATILHLAKIQSDHAPLFLDTFGEKNLGPRPFKFEQMWIRDENRKVVVRNAWESPVVGSIPYQFCKRIGNTRRSLKEWSKSTFGGCDLQVKSLTKKIDVLQQQPLSDGYLAKEVMLVKKLDEVLTRNDLLWQQD